jgi:hypothetical protein
MDHNTRLYLAVVFALLAAGLVILSQVDRIPGSEIVKTVPLLK